MRIAEFFPALDLCLKARVTPLIWGAHGIGKTSLLDQWAREGGHCVVNQKLGNLADRSDLIGIYDFKLDAEGRRVATTALMPEWMHRLFMFAKANPDRHAVLFLDEINRVGRDMIAPMLQLVLERRLNEFEFLPNMHVVAAANPPTPDYPGTLNIRDAAWRDRLCHLKLEPTTDEWATYAQRVGLDPTWVAWVRSMPEVLTSNRVAFTVGDYATPSNRSLEAAARLDALGASAEVLAGLIGPTNVAAFQAFRDKLQAESPTVEEVLKGYRAKSAAKVAKLVAGSQFAALGTLASAVIAHFDAAEVEATTAEADAVARLIMDYPLDLGFSFARRTQKCRALAYVIGEHKGLIKYMRDAIAAGRIDVTKTDDSATPST